ncbi:hypothetical protein [Marinomonas sp. 2405UD68-3]|uniref:hypothetical protein n=1 Tax=Marinomonas sp. 2405UD68-3 TaxID=3391835 RepID=UPI0039C948E5
MVKKHEKPELGERDFVKGFTEPDPRRPNDLVLNGGDSQWLVNYTIESHLYDMPQVNKKVRLKMAEVASAYPEMKGPEKQKRKDEIKELIMSEMRRDGATKIKIKDIPVLITNKNILFVGFCAKSEDLQPFLKILMTAGVPKIKIVAHDSELIRTALTAALMSSDIVGAISFQSPVRGVGDQQVSLGGECDLRANSQEGKERAKFFDFVLDDRDEIINLIESGKAAHSCQFRFFMSDMSFRFVYSVDGVFSSIGATPPEGLKAEEPTASEAVSKSSYAMHSMHLFIERLMQS